MSVRKPLDPKCNGGVFCPVEGHLVTRATAGGTRFGHIPLTAGQNRTLHERWRLAEKRARDNTPTPCDCGIECACATDRKDAS